MTYTQQQHRDQQRKAVSVADSTARPVRAAERFGPCCANRLSALPFFLSF